MSIPSRHANVSNIVAEVRTFFVTSSTWGRRPVFQTVRMCDLIDNLYHYRREGRYLLHEFVLMKDHFHLQLTVDEKTSIERAVQFIKGGFSYRAKKELDFRSAVWEKGFSDHRLRRMEEVDPYRRYIHENPVKAGIVSEASQYQYSSARAGYDLDPLPQRLEAVQSAARQRRHA